MIVPLTHSQKRALALVNLFYQPPVISSAQSNRLRFGLIADPQYADVDTEQQRYYRHTLTKLRQVINILNQHSLDFVVTLGDIVDRYWQDYTAILPLYQQLRHPHIAIIGNHDAAVISEHLNAQRPILALPKQYYAISLTGFRLLIIDGNDLSFYCTPANGDDCQQAAQLFHVLSQRHAPNAQNWNGGLSTTQYHWLETQLQQAQTMAQTVLVFAHYPLMPGNAHSLWNYEQVVELLCRYSVRAVFSGHDHRGGYHRMQETDFIILHGMVEGANEAPFAIVEVQPSQLSVTGYGPQPSLSTADRAC